MPKTVRYPSFWKHLLIILVASTCFASAQTDVLSRLLQIAEPDQIQAFSNLNLTSKQASELRTLASSYLPQVQAQKVDLATMLTLANDALAKADKILTPEQRPLARKLLPRPHQWSALRQLYLDTD